MPGYDRRGPMGTGPMTGGRRGDCGRTGQAAGSTDYGGGYGRGMSCRRGFGRGRGRDAGPVFGGYAYPPLTDSGYPVRSADEMAMLRADADAMKQSLETIQGRIAELEKKASQ